MAPPSRTSESDRLVLRNSSEGILRLTLNDPATRKSLSSAMMTALAGALSDAAAEETVRVIVIAAMGPAFSSGHNLREITAHRSDPDGGRRFFEQLMDQCSSLMQSIVEHDKPVIAEVQGIASAAGCQLVASCDLAVASESASFCTPGVNIGLFCSTPMVALSRNVSQKHAMEMLLTGDTVAADEALRIGLINRIAPPNRLAEEVDELARKIASKSQATVRLGKKAFYRQLDMPLAKAYDLASRVMVENLIIRDAEEGIGAFIQKRAPQWQDR
jgi:enoyl-CoA hydratase/carnithine racemase